MNEITLKIPKRVDYEEKFFIVFKYVLKRGANYLRQDTLHLLNKMVKESKNAFVFFSNFKNFVENF
jgi:hypothetical protein